jgi:hypothetical protein
MMKKLAIALCLAASLFVPVFGQDPCSQTDQLNASAQGVQSWNGTKNATPVGGTGDDAYGVEAWTEAGGDATKLTWYGPNQGGGYAFRAEWTNSTDYLGRFGYFWGNNGKKWSNLGDLCVDYNYKRSANGTGGSYSYLGVYGWTIGGTNTEAEYYIVEDWFGDNQQNASNLGNNCQTHGNITVDGKTYQVVTCIRPAGSGCVSCGGQPFGQVFSIRQGMRNPEPAKCGTISIKKHFEEWTKLTTEKCKNDNTDCQSPFKYIYDKTYESKFLVEAQSGTGWFDATYMKFSRTGECGLPAGYFSLSTAASPSAYGSVARNPNNTSFASGTKVTLTATANPGWAFAGWGGGASGSANPIEITMDANKAITANFIPANTDPEANLVADGNFPGTSLPSSWTLNQGDGYGNSAATSSVASNKVTINVTTKGSEVWEPQLVQNGITLVNGMSYVLSFDASASPARTMGMIIQMAGGDYATYFQEPSVSLTTQTQTFTYTFTMEAPSDESGRIGFNLGQATGPVTISNVKLSYAPITKIQNPIHAVKFTVHSLGGKMLRVESNASTAIYLYDVRGNLAQKAQVASGSSMVKLSIPSGVYVVKNAKTGQTQTVMVK